MTNAAYDAIADWYDEYVRTEPLLYEVVTPAALQLIEETGSLAGAVICDMACGQGVLVRELASRGAYVTGIDISERLLALAASRSRRLMRSVGGWTTRRWAVPWRTPASMAWSATWR